MERRAPPTKAGGYARNIPVNGESGGRLPAKFASLDAYRRL